MFNYFSYTSIFIYERWGWMELSLIASQSL